MSQTRDIRSYFAGRVQEVPSVRGQAGVLREVEAVPGLFYAEEVVRNEQELVAALDALEWSAVGRSRAARRVQQFGYRYDYRGRALRSRAADGSSSALRGSTANSLPAVLEPLRDALQAACLQLGLVGAQHEFNQCIVNNYEPGQGIAPHIDHAAFGGVIGCFTLGSAATMEFAHGGRRVELRVAPRSLYVMSGPARHTWTHEMAPRKTDPVQNKRVPRGRRVSVTFRSVN